MKTTKPTAGQIRKLETIIFKLEMLSQEVPRESAQELIQAKSVLIRTKNQWASQRP